MASRAPLLVAAALFVVGVAGLLATLPGSEAGRAFLAPPRAAVTTAPPVDSGTLARVAEVPQIPVQPKASVAHSEPLSAGVVADATVTEETPVPSPEPLRGAVIAAVASDEPPTPPPLHAGFISADGDDDSTANAETATPSPTESPAPSETPSPTPQP